MELDKKVIIEKVNRYTKLNLTGVWSVSGRDGKLSFTIPPLASSGFAQPSKNECIIKIRKVYIDANNDRGDEILWGPISSAIGVPIAFNNGVSLMTSIMSRNNYFLTGVGQDVSGMSSTNTDFSASKLGVMVKGTTEFNSVDRGYRADGGITFFDNSDIMSSGTLCSNPFGQKVDVWVQREDTAVVLVPFKTTGTQAKAGVRAVDPVRFSNCSLRVELEVYVL